MPGTTPPTPSSVMGAGSAVEPAFPSPAVGEAAAAELLGDAPPFDLAAYRLDRFAGGTLFPEEVVL